MNEPSPRKPRRRWWFLAAFAGGVLAAGFLGIVLIARECGKEQFSAALAQLLGKRLNADVSLAPMRSHSLVFLECPEVFIRARSGHWAFQARDVSLEFLPSGFLTGGLAFRSLMMREGELWLGANPEPVKDVGGDATGAPLPPAAVLPWWLEGRFQELGRVPIENIAVTSLKVRIPGLAPESAAGEVDTSLAGRFHDGKLEWRFEKGAFRFSQQEPWSLTGMGGSWQEDQLRVESGALTSPDGAVASFRSQQEGQAPGDLVLEIEAKQFTLPPPGMEVEEVLGSLSSAKASARGVLRVQFPEVQRFRFSGDVELEGLNLGESRIFRLLAGQTGSERLRHPGTGRMTGRMESTPGVIRLSRLGCEEEGLFRLEGWLSVVSKEMLGVFDLALPAPLVGNMPGGKPKGFSYPASGWSWARLRVEGKSDCCQEDLSQRLMAQISRDIPVKAGPPLESQEPGRAALAGTDEQRREARIAANHQRVEAMEKLFYSLIGD